MITLKHADKTKCLYCGQTFGIQATLNLDMGEKDFDRALLVMRRYKAKKDDILNHRLQCEVNFMRELMAKGEK